MTGHPPSPPPPSEHHWSFNPVKWLQIAYSYGRRVIALEARMKALEDFLRDEVPPDACRYCGKRAMRKTHDGPLMGNQGTQWKEETWTCAACKETERRPFKLK
jgi:hypothetical protein